jgi:hypothetical protein
VLSRLAVVVRVDPEMIRVETLNGKSTSGKETKRSHATGCCLRDLRVLIENLNLNLNLNMNSV